MQQLFFKVLVGSLIGGSSFATALGSYRIVTVEKIKKKLSSNNKNLLDLTKNSSNHSKEWEVLVDAMIAEKSSQTLEINKKQRTQEELERIKKHNIESLKKWCRELVEEDYSEEHYEEAEMWCTEESSRAKNSNLTKR